MAFLSRIYLLRYLSGFRARVVIRRLRLLQAYNESAISFRIHASDGSEIRHGMVLQRDMLPAAYEFYVIEFGHRSHTFLCSRTASELSLLR